MEEIDQDVLCEHCASSLRSRNSTGKCAECGMEISKSLSVAAAGSDNPKYIEDTIAGLRTQSWCTLASLLACVAGPLIFHGSVTMEAFAFASAVALSAVAAWQLAPLDAARRNDAGTQYSATRRRACGLVMTLSGVVMVLPAFLLSTNVTRPAGGTLVVIFLAGAVVWFLGECLKLRILEHCAAGVPGRQLARRARNLRIGAYLATILLGIGVIPMTSDKPISGAYLVTGSVALFVLTMLSALLYNRVSQSLQRQATFARAVRKHMGITTHLASKAA